VIVLYETVGTQVEMVITLMTPLAVETPSVLALEEYVTTGTVPLEYGDGTPEAEVAIVVGTLVTASGVPVVVATTVLEWDRYGQSVTVSAQE